MKNILSPKEKAKELVDKMMLYSYEKKEYDDSSTQYIVNYKIKKEYAKQCALVAVDEMIQNGNLEPQVKRHIGNVEPSMIHLEYWFQVKKEIEKL